MRVRATSCEVNKTSIKIVRNTHRRSRATNKKREKIVLRAVRTVRCAVRALGWRAGVFQERLWSCPRAFLGDLGAQLGSSRPPLGQPELVLGRPMAVPGRSGDVPERPGIDARPSEPPQIDFGAILGRFSIVLGSSRRAARVFFCMFLLSFSLVRHAVPTRISIELSRVLRDLVTQKLAEARFARGLVARPSRHSNAPFPCASHLPPSIYIYIYTHKLGK